MCIGVFLSVYRGLLSVYRGLLSVYRGLVFIGVFCVFVGQFHGTLSEEGYRVAKTHRIP